MTLGLPSLARRIRAATRSMLNGALLDATLINERQPQVMGYREDTSDHVMTLRNGEIHDLVDDWLVEILGYNPDPPRLCLCPSWTARPIGCCRVLPISSAVSSAASAVSARSHVQMQ